MLVAAIIAARYLPGKTHDGLIHDEVVDEPAAELDTFAISAGD